MARPPPRRPGLETQDWTLAEATLPIARAPARPIELPHVVALLTSAASMVVEIVGGRMITPNLGASVYTWTGVIGVVLAGLSLGAALGGLVADRWPGKTTLGVTLVLTALATLSVLPVATWALDWVGPVGWSFHARVLATVAAIFFLPSLMYGLVPPIAARLLLRDLDRAGSSIGRLYALSTLGGIAGTFLAGFFLVEAIGSRGSLVVVAALVCVLGISTLAADDRRYLPLVAVGLFVVVLLGTTTGGQLRTRCLLESAYYCIRVDQRPLDENTTLQVLVLDHLVHSFSDLKDPERLHYDYEQVFAEIADYTFARRGELTALFLGGGGYTLPRYLEFRYPTAEFDVIEIDPAVTETAVQWLGLPTNTRVVTHNADARIVVGEMARQGRRFSIVFGDAFNDVSVPYQLTTLEFDRQIAELVGEYGIYTANIIDNMQRGQFLRSVVWTLREVFANVYIANTYRAWEGSAASTYVVVASQRPIDFEDVRTMVQTQLGRPWRVLVMPRLQMADWMAERPAVILTDDYAPVDKMLLPLVEERN